MSEPRSVLAMVCSKSLLPSSRPSLLKTPASLFRRNLVPNISYSTVIIDMFGLDVRFSDETDETVTVSVTVNEMAMLQFARSFAPDVVLLEPKELAEKVKNTAERTVEVYKDI